MSRPFDSHTVIGPGAVPQMTRTPFDMEEQRRRQEAFSGPNVMPGTPTPVAPELENLKDHLNKVMPLVEDVVKENAELRRQLDLTRQRLETLEKLAHQYFDVIVGMINKNRVNDADGRD